MVGAKSQHPAREVLIGKFQRLGVVIGIDDDHPARGPRNPHHLAQGAMRIG